MNDKNICLFAPDGNGNEKLHVINYVLEKKHPTFNGLKRSSVYQMYYVIGGEGVLRTSNKDFKLERGDIFFTFPSSPFAVESLCDLEYMYVSYLGVRANMICDSLGINRNNCVFRQYSEVEPFWRDALTVSKEASTLRFESVALYTFSVLAERLIPTKRNSSSDDAVQLAKKYIDENISNSELSLEKISAELSYNTKYLSSLFKRKMGIGISEYISTVRIQHACTLMEQGFTSIKDIAAQCGFKDALYFSKVFKRTMTQSPKEHIAQIEKKGQAR